MAAYVQLIELHRDATLRSRIMVACVVAAETIRVEAPATPKHAERLAWAKRAYLDPQDAARDLVWSVLAQNKALDPNTIQGSSDVALQSAVDAALTGIL